MYPQMYIFFSQSPSLSRPLLHTSIFSILSAFTVSLSLSSAAFFRNSSLQQTALSRNQQFCLREFRIKAITEPNRMKHSHQISHLSEGLAFSQTDSDFELLCITDMFLLSFTLFTVSKKES